MQNKIALCIVFLLLLTIILYGLAKAVIKMSFSQPNQEKLEEYRDRVAQLDWKMYVPQLVLLVLAFVLGIYMPEKLVLLITGTLTGLN